MSAVSLLSTLREKPTDDSLQNACKNEGDEELSGSAGGGGGDPAVLAVGPARSPLTYTREQLLRIRESPLVKRGLDQLPPGDRLALVLKKRSESPPNEEDKGGRGDAPNENQKGVYARGGRSADPRERVRKESEGGGGIVLSPQRRSFTSGCGAPAAPAPPPPVARTRPESPLSAPAAATPATKPDQGRRIGSGRIMVRDGATWEEGEYRPGAEPYRPPRPSHNRNNNSGGSNTTGNNDRFERRSFGRDSYSSDMKRERDDRFNNDKNHTREDNRRSGGRFSQRRLEKEDEPEWFSGGPTSQHDTIELRGFDEPARSNDKEENGTTNGNQESNEPERWRDSATRDNDTSNDKDSGVECKTEEAGGGEQPDFNLDEFLKFDCIPDVLTNGGGASSEGGSRFSRWFRRDTPSDTHYETLLHSMVDELDKSSVPESGGGVFAPISPAPPSLLQLLRRANAQPQQESAAAGNPGKIHSLQELEARLRPQPHHAGNASDHDLSAFKRLLAQVCGGQAVPAAEPAPAPPMSLLQMLNKSMEQQQQQQQQPKPHIPQDLLYKLLQLQQRQQQQQQSSGDLTVNDRELLQRPEAQAILHGLNAGEITLQHLMQQLHNPGLQSRHRDLLLTVLRVHHHHTQMGGSPLSAPAAPHLVLPPHQPLRLSPLPHAAGPARIPSPRELAAHTQSIMQGALIKKKLEEQRENYRRRQEMQHHKQHAISFTPTSVLRKMTAEKEAEAPSPKQQWSQPQKIPQGRPIVKGNQSGAAPPMNYQSDYQQHYMNQQQQMMGGVRPFAQNQQRQASNSQFNNVGSLRGIPAGSTLHQLLVQSHQRTLNEMGGPGAGTGGGDNQLARWFSPELLARASAGKLPSVHVPNALSLEDLERHHHSPAPPLRN